MAKSRVGRITLQAIQKLESGHEIRDQELRCFGARRQSAAVSYFVHTRIDGRLKRLTIGKHGSPWTPETARREAARLLTAIRGGEDPARERDERRLHSATFEEVAEEFIEIHGRKLKPRSCEEYARIIRRQLTRAFKGRRISEIKSADVARAHASWSATPRAANHAVTILSKLLKWAALHGYRAAHENPCAGIQKYRENKRERFLSEEELARLGRALSDGEHNPYVVGALRMLILTGARLTEITTLRWSYVDLPRRALRLPDSKTGRKVIVLNAQAVAVLEQLPRIQNNPWVFPGHRDGQHIVNIQKPWRHIRSSVGLDDVRIHDLRHSFASFAITAGGTLPQIGHLLGHTQAQTTLRYAHVAPNPAQRIAEATGARIAEVWGLTETDSVG